jgi:CRISPR/Cas system CSM-associated protein Csm3 (group 7 of RAMP superfamily)
MMEVKPNDSQTKHGLNTFVAIHLDKYQYCIRNTIFIFEIEVSALGKEEAWIDYIILIKEYSLNREIVWLWQPTTSNLRRKLVAAAGDS